MSFGNPNILKIGVIITLLLTVFMIRQWRVRQALIGKFVRSKLLAELTVGVSKNRQKLRLAMLICATALILIGMASPRWGMEWQESNLTGLDIVVAIDTSKSMLATDISPDRLTRAKLAALDILRLSTSDRLGLVAFAGSSFLQCPLTFDDEAFKQCLDALDTDIIPLAGTGIADAIKTAQDAFNTSGENEKVIIILSDGEDHQGNAVEAAKSAAANGIKIFTIGIGSPEGDIIRVKDNQNKTEYLKDEFGNVVKTRLNEQLLMQIAQAGNGAYTRLVAADTIETLFSQAIAPLRPVTIGTKTDTKTKYYQRPRERYIWFIIPALILVAAEMFIPDRKSAPGHANSRIPLVLFSSEQ
jgi:Ca-activated chloride channel family protein